MNKWKKNSYCLKEFSPSLCHFPFLKLEIWTQAFFSEILKLSSLWKMSSIWTNILRGSFLDLKSDPRISEKGWKIEETSNIFNLISEYLGIKLHGMSDKMTDSGKTWGKERGFCFVINGNIFFHFSRSFAGKTTYFKKWHPLILKWRFFFQSSKWKKYLHALLGKTFFEKLVYHFAFGMPAWQDSLKWYF